MPATTRKKPAAAQIQQTDHVEPVPCPVPQPPRAVLAGIDACQLVELLDRHFSDHDESPYRRLYNRVRAAVLELMGHIDAMVPIEGAIRHAGFVVVGFETCRQLLLGDLDLEAIQNQDGAE